MLFRTHIRDVTAAQIEALGLFTTVFNARAPIIVREQLPCCKIWTPSENGSNLSIGVPELRQSTTLIIQIVLEGTQDVENQRYLDELCEAVVLHLVEDPTWLVRFERLLSMGTEIETSIDGEMRTVTATITMEIQYNLLFITRVPDLLQKLNMGVVVGDPDPAPGNAPPQIVQVPVPLDSVVEAWPLKGEGP